MTTHSCRHAGSMLSAVCRLLLAIACVALATDFTAAESPRERLSLDAGWKFHLGIGGMKPDVNLDFLGEPANLQWSRSLFNGLAQIIVQSSRDAGEIKLTASAGGIAPATFVLQTKPCAPRPSVPCNASPYEESGSFDSGGEVPTRCLNHEKNPTWFPSC